MDPYKMLVTEFLTEDFVENYEYHRLCVDSINLELQGLDVPFAYKYDEYCKELLNRFLIVVDKYFETPETAEDFFETYEEIVSSTLLQMKNSKIPTYGVSE